MIAQPKRILPVFLICAGFQLSLYAAALAADQTPIATVTESVSVLPYYSRAERTDIVCKKEYVTGSRLATRETCKTKAQWDLDSDIAQREFNEFVGKSKGNTR
jgi:hypothetical protein